MAKGVQNFMFCVFARILAPRFFGSIAVRLRTLLFTIEEFSHRVCRLQKTRKRLFVSYG